MERSCQPSLRAHLEYDADGAVLFRLSGHEERRRARVLNAFQSAVRPADREWAPEQGSWVLFGGWDEELQELLEEYFGLEEVFVDGRPLREDDAD